MRRIACALLLIMAGHASAPSAARAQGAARANDAAAPPAAPATAPRTTPPAAPPSDPRALTYPPLGIAFPKPERFFLPNGLLVYLFVDHEVPLIDLAFNLRSGSIYDPPDKAGLADLATGLLRTAGTKEMTPDQVDEMVDLLPVRIALSADEDLVSGSISALKAKFPEALGMFAAMIRTPRFDPGRVDLEKARVLEEIRRRWDDPGTIAELNFRLLAYGTSSPWARLASAASIGRIGRQDLLDFHQRYFHPNNMVMGVAGDFEPAAMKRLLGDTFGSWPRAKVTPPQVPKIKDSVPVGVHIIERPLTQSNIEIGHLGVARFDPDKFPLKILNFILGEGGFTSRLMREVRSTRGLAYSVGGGVGMDSDRGLFQISCRTKAATTVEAIQVIRDILKQMREQGPTDQEVRDAKEASVNSFVFSVDGTVPYMQAFLYYDSYGYPADYLQTYRDNISKVTREQVLGAARKHIDPDRLVVLVVGDPKGLGRPLTSLGLGEPRALSLEESAVR
jgi:zinc protease